MVPRCSAELGAPASQGDHEAPPEDDPSVESEGEDKLDWPEGCEDAGMRRARCHGCDEEFIHMLTHKPVDPIHCETCMIAKFRHVKHFLGSLKRVPTVFGDLIAFDHMGMKAIVSNLV